MKIAHLSDLHFSHFTKNPLQLFSKTWIGNANLLLKRGQVLQPLDPETLIAELKNLKIDLCLISGDLSTTSQPKEFVKAQEFVKKLRENGFEVLCIPGNHDRYTQKASKKELFYHYLSNPFSKAQAPSYRLKKERFELYFYKEMTLILMDQTLPTPWFTAYGTVLKNRLKTLKEALSKVPFDRPFIFVGHFPILKKPQEFASSLKHAEMLYDLLKTIPSVYYFHGHNHHYRRLEDPHSELIQIDSGSISDIHKGSFHFFDVNQKLSKPYFRTKTTFQEGAH